MTETQNDRPRPGYGVLYIAMLFGLVALFGGVVPVFSLAVRLWITVGGDILMVATLVVWVLASRRADNLRRTRT